VQGNSLDAVLLCRDLLKAEIENVRSAMASPTVGTFPTMLPVGKDSSATQTEQELVIGTESGPAFVEVSERRDSVITVSTSCLSPTLPADVVDERVESVSTSSASPAI